MENNNIPDFFETSRDYICLIDKSGKIMDINPGGYQLLGYEKSHILGKNIAEIIPDEFAKKYSDEIEKVISNKKGIFESVLTNNQGKKIPVEIHAYNITYKNNEAVFAMHRDISLRKEIESMLDRSEVKSKKVFNDCPDGILMVNKDGKILDANVAYINSIGYSKDELIKINFFDLIADENRMESAAHIQKIILNGNASFTGSHKAKNGKIWTSQIRASYHDDTNSFILAFMSEKENLEKLIKELNKSKQGIQKVIDDASTGVLLAKPDGSIHYANKEVAKWLGYSIHELVKLNSRDFVFPDEMTQEQRDALRLGVYDGTIKEYAKKMRYKRKNGDLVWGKGYASQYIATTGEKYLIVQYEKLSENEQAIAG